MLGGHHAARPVRLYSNMAPGIARSRALLLPRAIIPARRALRRHPRKTRDDYARALPRLSGRTRGLVAPLVSTSSTRMTYPRGCPRARGEADRPGQRAGLRLFPIRPAAGRPIADKGADAQRAMTELVQLAAKQGGLVEAALPIARCSGTGTITRLPIAGGRRAAISRARKGASAIRRPCLYASTSLRAVSVQSVPAAIPSWSGGGQADGIGCPLARPCAGERALAGHAARLHGIDRSSQQAAHKPPRSPTPPPHAGQRGDITQHGREASRRRRLVDTRWCAAALPASAQARR